MTQSELSVRLKSRRAVAPSQWYLPAGSTGDTAIETARVHHAARWRGGRVGARGARAAAADAGHRLLQRPIARSGGANTCAVPEGVGGIWFRGLPKHCNRVSLC